MRLQENERPVTKPKPKTPPMDTIVEVPLEELYLNEWNPRTITEEAFATLKRSLADDPTGLQARPLIAMPDGTIIGGNMRYRAAEALGWKTIPVVFHAYTEEQARVVALRDNNSFGDYHEEALAEMLYELEQAGADLSMTGFTKRETTKLLDSVADHSRGGTAAPDDPAPEPPARPRSKPGTVYELGRHRLMCGDATEAKDVAKLLGTTEPKLMVTDPPYGVSLDLAWRADAVTDANRKKGKATSGKRTKKAGPSGYDAKTIGEDVRVDWSAAYELVPSLVVCYVWFADKFVADVAAGLDRIGYTTVQMIIWDKMQFVLSRSYYHWRHETALYVARLAELGKSSDVPWYGDAHVPAIFAKRKDQRVPWLGDPDQPTVWPAPSPKRIRSDVEGEEPVDHPTQKPTLLYTRPYTNHTLRGEPVYEPFSGSGTALIAAEMTGRTCFAMELDPAFVDVARERYELFTGEKT